MTQFALFKMEPKLSKVKLANDSFYDPILCSYFKGANRNDIYIFEYNGRTIDNILIDLQKRLVSNRDYSDLDLEIRSLIKSSEEALFWYGSDYCDLPTHSNIDQVMESIVESAKSPSCEVYVHYIK